MIITFIGNCQTIALCYYLQRLLNNKSYTIYWLLFDKWFQENLGEWSDKCLNKIIEYNDSLEIISLSDIVIFQEVIFSKSLFCNEETLKTLVKPNCKLIKIPSIHLKYDNYNAYLDGLRQREIENNVDITVSDIFDSNKDKCLMLSLLHPNTFLFLEILKKICIVLNIDFFNKEDYCIFMEDDNYIGLPG